MDIKNNRNPLCVTVKTPDGEAYGGNQHWCDTEVMKLRGCGAVAAANVILTLQGKLCVEKEEYQQLVRELSRRYLWVIPKIGLDGFSLQFGMNRYFRRMHMPYRTRWGCRRKILWEEVRRMLDEGIPVIIAVGPNFPFFWKAEKVRLYSRGRAVLRVHDHYMTVTGMNEEWITVSSWGKCYEIYKAEFEEYQRKYSNGLLTSVLKVRKL